MQPAVGFSDLRANIRCSAAHRKHNIIVKKSMKNNQVFISLAFNLQKRAIKWPVPKRRDTLIMDKFQSANHEMIFEIKFLILSDFIYICIYIYVYLYIT